MSGNALVEGATFAAIIGGLIAGGLAAGQGRAAWSVVLQLLSVAVCCWGAACFIPATGVGAPGLKVNPNPFASTLEISRELRSDDRQWVGGNAVSWFWLVAAVTLSLAPVIIKSRIGGGIEIGTAVNLFFAIGVAGGSLAAAILAHGRIRLAPAPYLLLGMAGFLVDLGLTTGAMPQTTARIGLVDFFTSAVGLRLAFDMIALSAACGLFVVPIFTAVQAWAHKDQRARSVAAVNALNAVYMVLGSLATSLLL